MPDKTPDYLAKLASLRTDLNSHAQQLRAMWVGLAQTSAVIERATLAYKESQELLNDGTHPPAELPAYTARPDDGD
jgi:hypothetical protein